MLASLLLSKDKNPEFFFYLVLKHPREVFFVSDDPSTSRVCNPLVLAASARPPPFLLRPTQFSLLPSGRVGCVWG